MNVGTILAGKYRLEAVLGRGGMGSVWRAHHLGLDAPVAVKLMDPAVMSTPGMLQRFHREAQAAAQLRSPHVVQIIDHGVDAATSTPFIAMELLEGESLLDRLVRVRTLSPLKTARLVTDVCRALSRAHEAGIIHRDLKPANLFLVSNEDQEITKVLDFGIAKSPLPLLGVDSTTNTGTILGTPLYMSPEQISGGKFVDPRSDLWSLAVVACECLTGRRPFSADSIGALTLIICTEPLPIPSRLGPVPDGFDAWFERAVARDPSSRFQTAREFAKELRRICGLGSSDELDFPSHKPPNAEERSPLGDTTARQWGKTPRALGSSQTESEPLPLAPTVDVKYARTGDALAKSSHEIAIKTGRPAFVRLGIAATLVVGIAASLFTFSASQSELRVSPDAALPATAAPAPERHSSSAGMPIVALEGAPLPAASPSPQVQKGSSPLPAGSAPSPAARLSGTRMPQPAPARASVPTPSASQEPVASTAVTASASSTPAPAPPPKTPTLEDVINERR